MNQYQKAFDAIKAHAVENKEEVKALMDELTPLILSLHEPDMTLAVVLYSLGVVTANRVLKAEVTET